MRVFFNSFETEAEESLKRASLILAGIKGGAYKAVGSALKRAASAGKTEVKKLITQEYNISAGLFLSETKNINHYEKSSSGDITVAFGFRGSPIPLIKFSSSVGRGGKVQVQVKKSGSKQALDHAFIAKVGGHTGVFERETPERLPIRQLFGPATTQMIYSNDVVLDKMEEKMLLVFNGRIDHEINAILNGFRR